MLITGSSSGIGYECADKFKDQYEIVGVSKTPGPYVTEVGDLRDSLFRRLLVDKYQPDVFINNAASGDNGNETGGAIALLNALTTSAVAIGDSFIAAIDNDTNVYLYLVQQVSTADTIAAQDVTAIGVLNGITTVANGDFVSI